MDLKEFIENSLNDIVNSLDSATKKSKEYSFKQDGGLKVSFDISVKSNDSKSGKGKVMIFDTAGISGSKVQENSNASRIKFDIWINNKRKSQIYL